MMRHRKTFTKNLLSLCLVFAQLGVLTGADEKGRPENLPVSFRFIGNYQLNSKLRVENGVSDAVVISPLVYRVFSDGMEVRVYCRTAGEDSFTAYDIYRSDGVGVSKASGEIELVAGVQAFSTKGKMLRQISVTRTSLTMLKAPPRSHRVIVTRAKALPVSDTSETIDR